MDLKATSTLGLATGATLLAANAANHFDSSVVMAESASTLETAADIFEVKSLRPAAVGDAGGHGVGSADSAADFLTRRADDIEFGGSDILGHHGPDRFSMPAVAPLRRASTMPAAAGLAELRSAVGRASSFESAALRSAHLSAAGAAALLVFAGVGLLIHGTSRDG